LNNFTGLDYKKYSIIKPNILSVSFIIPSFFVNWLRKCWSLYALNILFASSWTWELTSSEENFRFLMEKFEIIQPSENFLIFKWKSTFSKSSCLACLQLVIIQLIRFAFLKIIGMFKFLWNIWRSTDYYYFFWLHLFSHDYVAVL
jgi:hypothetical protein